MPKPKDTGSPRSERAKKGQMYNSEYEQTLKNKGYKIIGSRRGAGGTRHYDVEKDGVGSAIIRADVPDPERQLPKMRVIKKAPRTIKRRQTRRKFGKTI
jgi:hypothetical protein